MQDTFSDKAVKTRISRDLYETIRRDIIGNPRHNIRVEMACSYYCVYDPELKDEELEEAEIVVEAVKEIGKCLKSLESEPTATEVLTPRSMQLASEIDSTKKKGRKGKAGVSHSPLGKPRKCSKKSATRKKKTVLRKKYSLLGWRYTQEVREQMLAAHFDDSMIRKVVVFVNTLMPHDYSVIVNCELIKAVYDHFPELDWTQTLAQVHALYSVYKYVDVVES